MSSPSLSPNYQAVDYLLGSAGQADGDTTYHADGTAESEPMARKSFRHHLFQRIVKTGESGNPAVKIQFSLVQPAKALPEDWTTITTLNNSKTWDYFSNVAFPYIRAVRDDSVADKIKVMVSCSNDLCDAS